MDESKHFRKETVSEYYYWKEKILRRKLRELEKGKRTRSKSKKIEALKNEIEKIDKDMTILLDFDFRMPFNEKEKMILEKMKEEYRRMDSTPSSLPFIKI